jgi:uncharacterized protein YecE (DUF72 family)
MAGRRLAPASEMARQLRVGCSGWNYRAWRGRFYPADLPVARWLAYYAGVFDTVEVNNTFYRLPEASTFASWRTQTPSGFLTAIKASRFLTHVKRLKDPEEPLDRLFTRASALGSTLGPVLYQIPSNFHRDLTRLAAFLEALPHHPAPGARRRVRHVMEFRHQSWYEPEVFQLLTRFEVALCLHDKTGSAIDAPFVGPFVYVRFHGTNGHYHGSYSDHALASWAARLAEQWQQGREVYAYFNNDPDGVAPGDALRLRRALERLT